MHLLSARAVEVREGWSLIFEKLIVGNTRHLVALCREVVALTGYQGGWHLSIAIDGLHGGVSWDLSDRQLNSHVYSQDNYQQATTASAEELRGSPDGVEARAWSVPYCAHWAVIGSPTSRGCCRDRKPAPERRGSWHGRRTSENKKYQYGRCVSLLILGQ